MTGSVGSERTYEPGSTVGGKYVVRRVVGYGGMGVVLECWDPDLDRCVAVKLLREQSEDRILRFLREARLAAKLESEHVARVLNAGRSPDDVPFIVLEYLEGNDLSEELNARGSISVARAVTYLLQASEALAEAHERGIVHRDLKPSNLFLARRLDGRTALKVLDFGISKMTKDGADKVTETGSLLGTPVYMSPEQVRDPRDADTRSDIWALGVILHELLTGELPFVGASLPSLSAAIVTDAPKKLRSHTPELPEELELIVLRCLEKDPSRRFQEVSELARALAPFAPKDAERHVERIASLVGASARGGALRNPDAPTFDPEADTIIASNDRASAAADGGTLAASVAGGTAPARRRRIWPVVAVTSTLVIGASLWWLVDRRAPRVLEAPANLTPRTAVQPLVPQAMTETPTPARKSPPAASTAASTAAATVTTRKKQSVRPSVLGSPSAPAPKSSSDDFLRFRK